MSKDERVAIPIESPSSIQYARRNAPVRAQMDQASSASPAAIPRTARGLSLGRLEPCCAVARESAVATYKEEGDREGDWDEEDKAKEQQERDTCGVRTAELLGGV